MPLDLHTPKREQALKQAPETRPAALAEWLKALPRVSPEESAQKLLAELGRANRSELDADTRLKLTQLFEPVTRELIEALVTSLPENGTPQSVLHRQAANLACELAVELAHAWKLILLGMEQRRALFGGARTRLQALAQLLAALSAQIGTSYRTYSAPPARSWHELHQVHAALQQEAGTESSAASLAAEAKAGYKLGLLLALADPFRFTRPEIEVILAYLDKFSPLSHLVLAGRNSPSVFRLDIAGDAAFQTEAEAEAPPALALDTHELCKHLRSLIVKLKTGEPFRDIGLAEAPQGINGLHLLSRLHQSWRGANKRGFKRYAPGQTYVEVISGLPALHRLYEARQKSAGAADGSPAPARWRVVNDSASGLAISAHAQEVAQVRMGSPVALREENAAGAEWLLGAIRWGRMAKGQVVVAGVEKLSPHAAAVVLRFLEGNAASIGQPALLIPANPALQTDERLLLPRGLYLRGRAAELWHKGERRRIALGSLVEETAFFDLAELIPA